MKRKTILIIGIIILLFVVGTFLTIHYYPKHDAFSRISFLKLNIPLGGEAISNVKITNYKETEQVFALSFSNLEGIASLSETGFTLEVGEKKEVEIYFKDTKNEAGIYLGQLIIEAGNVIEKLPVVLEMYDPNYAFAIVYDKILKYDNVYPGGKLGIEVKVHDLGNIVSPTVAAKYSIKDFDNEVFLSEEEYFSVDGSKTILIDIPKSWNKGDYVFITEIDYKGTKSIASFVFTVEDKAEGWMSDNIKFFIVVILVFVVGILALFVYFMKTRDDLLMQLKKQQTLELSRNISYIKASKRVVKESKEAPAKKKKKLIQLEQIKKKVIKKIKAKQKEQRKKIKHYKKKEQKPHAKSQLEKWKTQGYKMYDTASEVKKVTKQNIRRQMEDFKETGYVTEFLKGKK
ncbi:MAG: hypothetical protein ISS82_05375 [Nanoarchaeota archaeon]|nr:hypothetical protein [Nanoarchaeota archaeon]